MINAEKVRYLTSLSVNQLDSILIESGYSDNNLINVEFVGITNGGQFCYGTKFFDNIEGEIGIGKVYLTVNPTTNTISAEF